MSITNHPNLHSVKLVTDITSSFYKSLRGKFTPQNIPEDMSKKLSTKILNFVDGIETLLDEYELCTIPSGK